MAPQLQAIGVVVADMATALGFYRRLGLDIPTEADTEAHVGVDLPGGIRIMFDTIELMEGFDPGYVAATDRGRIGLAFACESPAEVDGTHAALLASGYRSHLDPFDAFWGQRYATVYDPDGNAVDLFAELG